MPVDYSLISIGVILLVACYLVFLSIRNWAWHYVLIAVFALGSLAFMYSVDYVFTDILEPHQQIRIKVSLGLEDDPSGAGYNVNQSEDRDRFWWTYRKRLSERYADQTEVCSRAGYRLYLLYGR